MQLVCPLVGWLVGWVGVFLLYFAVWRAFLLYFADLLGGWFCLMLGGRSCCILLICWLEGRVAEASCVRDYFGFNPAFISSIHHTIM